MDITELENYFKLHNYTTYQRSSYDQYLKDMSFIFPIPAVHITGTNGKGSTANYIYQIYLKAGYKVGLYNSPYLDDATEMVSINGKQIDFETYNQKFNELKFDFERYNLSSFEMQTITAFSLFKEANLDLVIIEVGMGGYVDATNIINSILSIITSVSLEHTSYLGGTTSEIAYNKAGIIRENSPVLLGKIDEFALFAIKERIKKNNNVIHMVDEFYNEKCGDNEVVFDTRLLKQVHLRTPMLYQAYNACLAINAVKILDKQFPIIDEEIRKGLLTSPLNCRFEMIDKNIVVDGAHNPEAMEHLVESIQKFNSKPVHVIFASFKDKNFSQMLNILDRLSQDITITTFDHKRAKTEDEYFLFLSTYKFESDYLNKIKQLREEYPDDLILITGSLYFAGLVKRELKK